MIKKEFFGQTKSGQAVYNFILDNGTMQVEVLNYGGIIRSIKLPYIKEKQLDVVLGFDQISEYEENNFYFGATVGRYANRIKDGKFFLNGQEIQLAKNNEYNHLHGGFSGFDKKIWEDEISDDRLTLSYFSKHLEEGYPGNLKISVIFELSSANELKISYEGISDQDTICNLTNHSYFNLSGHGSGTIKNHQLKLNADFYTPSDKDLNPTGEILSVKGTKFDYTGLKYLKEELDTNFVLKDVALLKEAAELKSSQTGISLKLYTTKPGIQIYTANFLSNIKGKENRFYDKNDAVCLEPQFYPNSTGYSHFFSPILKADEKYFHQSVYLFQSELDFNH